MNECVWVDLVEEQDCDQQVLLLLRNKNVCIRYGCANNKTEIVDGCDNQFLMTVD